MLFRSLGMIPQALPLSPGAQGAAVAELQDALNKLGYKLASGEFDDATVTAVKGFQAKAGLAATGTVDEATWNVLVKEVATKGQPTPTDPRALRKAGSGAIQTLDKGGVQSLVTSTAAGKPLWQWGLYALAGLAAVYVVWQLFEENKTGLSGNPIRRLLADDVPRTRAEKLVEGKCTRVPSTSRLKDAETMEPV